MDLDRGLGGEGLVTDLVGDHPEGFDPEEVLLPARGPPQEKLERAVGGLEVIALVLEALQGVHDLGQGGSVQVEIELLGLELQCRLASQLGDDEPGPVADGVGGHVLVGIGPADDGAHVEAGLVGERR